MDIKGMLGPGPLGTPVGPGIAPLGAAPGGFAPLGTSFGAPTASAFFPSPFAAPGAFASPSAAFAVPPSPFAAPPGVFAAPPAAFAAPPGPFAAPPAAFAAPPGPLAAPPAIFAAPTATIAAERPVGGTYIETLRPTPQVIQGLAGLLRQLEATLPLIAVVQSLHAQARQIPEIAAQPQMEQFTKTAEKALCAEVAAIGFMRRMLCGDWSTQVLQGVREQMREASKSLLEAQVAFREVLSKPTVAQHPVVQVLRQSLAQSLQIKRVAFGQAQALGIAPVPEGEEA